MEAMHSYAVAEGHGLSHDPVKALVAPRPIGWLSTVDRDGRANLAPYSFFNAIASRPPMVMFASEGWKHSVANAQTTGTFVWNMATRALAEAMNVSSAPVDAEVDEFVLAGLAKAPSVAVAPPRVAASPAALECRVADMIRLKDAGGRELDIWLVTGEVVHVHIARRLIDADGLFDLFAAQPILRAGYARDYAWIGTDNRFEMGRPRS